MNRDSLSCDCRVCQMPEHSPIPTISWRATGEDGTRTYEVTTRLTTEELRRALACHTELRLCVESLEWRGNVTAAKGMVCPSCNGEYPHHVDGCFLQSVLAKVVKHA